MVNEEDILKLLPELRKMPPPFTIWEENRMFNKVMKGTKKLNRGKKSWLSWLKRLKHA